MAVLDVFLHEDRTYMHFLTKIACCVELLVPLTISERSMFFEVSQRNQFRGVPESSVFLKQLLSRKWRELNVRKLDVILTTAGLFMIIYWSLFYSKKIGGNYKHTRQKKKTNILNKIFIQLFRGTIIRSSLHKYVKM